MRRWTVLLVMAMWVMAAGSTAQVPHPDSAVADTTVAGIVARYIEALGGREAIEALKSRVCSGAVVTDLSSREQPAKESGLFTAMAAGSVSFYMHTWSADQEVREGFDGTTGWVDDPGGLRESPRVGRDKAAFLIHPQAPLHMEHYFSGLHYAGKATVNDSEVYVLEPDSLPPEHYNLYFNAETGLLTRIGYYWTLEDYREVDGVLIPHRIVASRKGGFTAYEIGSIAHGVEIPDDRFAMPATKE